MMKSVKESNLNLPIAFDKDTGRFVLIKDILKKKYPEPYVLISNMSKEDILRVVKERIRLSPEPNIGFLGGTVKSREDAFREIEQNTKIGNTLIEKEMIGIELTLERLNK